ANFNRLLQNVSDLSPTLREWMLLEGYGRVLARPALSIDLRELGIIAILTVKGLPRQLHSHLRGALRVGVSPGQLEDAIHLCAEYTTEERILSALAVLRNIN
ncbi:MAG TPA: carboxymuconolactone decarboxylase family protein, partial [Bacteroidetes bacterium]|nr:carboxymuconolactone decarboxylase family protein [Bacteroidota bacterium]